MAKRCRSLTQVLGLELAGIDLRQDAAGLWWCFEVNTSPGFIWFEDQTGQPIAQAVASLRAVCRSQQWDAFWQTQPQCRRPPVFPRRAA